MTAQQNFTAQEWHEVLEGPPAAGLLVITAQRGGLFRETISMAKSYAEARSQHGHSELLDAIVGANPKVDHTRYHSTEELSERSLGHIRDGVGLVGAKGTPEELDEYKRFIVTLAEHVAAAHREGGQAVSASEQAAINSIVDALG